MHLVVTGSVRGAPRAVVRSIRSVAEQTHRDHTHIVMCADEETRAAAEQASSALKGCAQVYPTIGEGMSAVESLLPVWRTFAPETPIVWLDGDDWLAVPTALECVSRAHESGAWVTWGSFITTQGEMGCAGPTTKNCRREVWRASHLKTFRAGLVQRMRHEDFFMADGSYCTMAGDLRVMFACIEMAPPGRARYLPQILCVYNVEHSFDVTASLERLDARRAEEVRIRAFAPYETLREK